MTEVRRKLEPLTPTRQCQETIGSAEHVRAAHTLLLFVRGSNGTKRPTRM